MLDDYTKIYCDVCKGFQEYKVEEGDSTDVICKECHLVVATLCKQKPKNVYIDQSYVNKSGKMFNPVTRAYYKIRTKDSKNGNKGSIIEKWPDSQ